GCAEIVDPLKCGVDIVRVHQAGSGNSVQEIGYALTVRVLIEEEETLRRFQVLVDVDPCRFVSRGQDGRFVQYFADIASLDDRADSFPGGFVRNDDLSGFVVMENGTSADEFGERDNVDQPQEVDAPANGALFEIFGQAPGHANAVSGRLV